MEKQFFGDDCGGFLTGMILPDDSTSAGLPHYWSSVMHRMLRKRNLALSGMAILLVAYATVEVFAGIQTNTINPTAAITHRGKKVLLTGPVKASAGEHVMIRVTLTQRTTGALAEGHAHFIATGLPQTWGVEVTVSGDERFEAGPATAVAAAVTNIRGHSTDAHQWIVNVMLASE